MDKRKRQAEIQKDKRWKTAVITAALAINLILGGNLYAQATRPVFDPNPQAITASSGEIKIPMDSLTENVMSKYSYDVDGVGVRFLLVKREGNMLVSGLDACDICGSVGYMQEQGNIENVICKNCNAPIPMTTVGYPGGCNPIPFKTEIKDNNVVIKLEDLTASKNVFAGKMH